MYVLSHKEWRYVCDVCSNTLAATQGTIFSRRRLPRDATVTMIVLLADGCPRQATVAALAVDERTGKSLEESAGAQCQQVHEHLVEQSRDLGQVQGDEIRAKSRVTSSGWRWRSKSDLALVGRGTQHGP